jgi:hypothetical protein
MDENRIELALRAGPPDERAHRQGALERALAARGDTRDLAASPVALRSPATPSITLLLAAAAVIVAVAVVGGFLGTRTGPGETPAPPPSASVTPSPSPSQASRASGFPTQLVDRWVGPVRVIPGSAVPAQRAVLDIQGANFLYDAGPGQPANLLYSTVAQEAPDVLRLTANAPSSGCTPFDEGTYRWSLSPGGSNLTLSLLDDACATRAAVLPGTWTHTACREAVTDCLGPVEAGEYRSTAFNPFGPDEAGNLRYTLPDGWANALDHPLNYALKPTADYLADPGFDGNDTFTGLYFWAGTVATDQPADCSAIPAEGVPVTAAAIADHIAQLDGLDVINRGATEIGGRTARVLDVSVDPAYSAVCPFSGSTPFRSLIMLADAGSDGGVQGLAASERARIYFVDVGPGRVTSIWVDGDATRIDGLIKDTAPILASVRFEASSPAP